LAVSQATAVAPSVGLPSKLRLAAADIKLAHSVFALPFAILGAFLARPTSMPWRDFLLALGLVVACMVSARTFAMLVNRLADRRFDAANARTARRAFASGNLSAGFGRTATGASAAVFILCTAAYWATLGNPWPLLLSVPVLGWLGAYSYTKRFTWLCHAWLGLSLALSPLAAAIAVHPASLGLPGALSSDFQVPKTPAIFWLSGMVACWVAGFDIIYALQDIDFDRSVGLRSVPSRLGWKGAAWVSRGLHAGALTCLVIAWVTEQRLGWFFGAGVAVVGGLLVAEHVVLAIAGKRGLPVAFFTLNGVISCLLGVLGVAELL
jgi:4-hydroxybenzoate polyprenyltransferase